MLTDKILLIDDDLEEHEVFCETLATVDKSLHCVGASSCSDGFAKLEASKGLPRYIFLDLNMPASHGKFCLQKLKNHPVYATVPVFIYTTSNREIDKYEAKKFGAQYFFNKPTSMGELKHILSYVISDQWKYS